MRLVTFTANGAEAIGVLDGDTVVDLSQAAPDLPADMNGFIEAGDAALAEAAGAVANAGGGAKHPAGGVRLLSPIPVPRRDVMAVGRNYHEHAREFHDSGFDATAGATAVPDHPIIFTKATTSVSGPGDPILTELDPTDSVDYEGELAVIIGKEGRGISREDAFDHVYGYTVCNDVTARNLQHQHKQWFIGKSPERFLPARPRHRDRRRGRPPRRFPAHHPRERREAPGFQLQRADIRYSGPGRMHLGRDYPQAGRHHRHRHAGRRRYRLRSAHLPETGRRGGGVTIEPLGTLENPVR